MKNIFKELRRHLWVIIVISLLSLNSYNISQNTYHCNSNAKAITIVAQSNGALADTFKMFIGDSMDYRKNIGDIISDVKWDVTKICGKLITMDLQILSNRGNIENLFKNDKDVETIINIMNKKPAYEYLKSVTVFVTGNTKEIKIEKSGMRRLLFHTSKQWCGTGVIVKIDNEYTYVLTNKHVAGAYKKSPTEIFVLHNKKEIKCEVIKHHKQQDLALLKFESGIKGKQPIKGIAFPQITERVYTVGHSLSRPFMYARGYFSGTIILHDVYQIPTNGGQSGSGIFNKDGYLIGLLYSVSGRRDRTGFVQWDNSRANAIKAIYIKEFLEENLK